MHPRGYMDYRNNLVPVELPVGYSPEDPKRCVSAHALLETDRDLFITTISGFTRILSDANVTSQTITDHTMVAVRGTVTVDYIGCNAIVIAEHVDAKDIAPGALVIEYGKSGLSYEEALAQALPKHIVSSLEGRAGTVVGDDVVNTDDEVVARIIGGESQVQAGSVFVKDGPIASDCTAISQSDITASSIVGNAVVAARGTVTADDFAGDPVIVAKEVKGRIGDGVTVIEYEKEGLSFEDAIAKAQAQRKDTNTPGSWQYRISHESASAKGNAR